MSKNEKVTKRYRWLIALPFAVVITAVYPYLFYRWFALADRYNIFLYYHDMGPLVPNTAPFSPAGFNYRCYSIFHWIQSLDERVLALLRPGQELQGHHSRASCRAIHGTEERAR